MAFYGALNLLNVEFWRRVLSSEDAEPVSTEGYECIHASALEIPTNGLS